MCTQYHDHAVLYWGPDGEFIKTVYNNPATAFPDMRSAPCNISYTAYAALASKVTQVNKFEFVSFPTVVSDDDESTTSEDTRSENSGEDTGDGLQNNESSVLHIPDKSYTEENLTDFTTLPEDDTLQSPNVVEDDVVLNFQQPPHRLSCFDIIIDHWDTFPSSS